jgi:copper chaperone NosL
MTPGVCRAFVRPCTGIIVAAMCLLIGAACRSGIPNPAVLDPRADACATCRMMVSDPRFASQIVAPYEEPKFFDDLGCLANYLQRTPALPAGAVVYVADHRTKAWVPANRAVFTRLPGRAAPMGSPIVAHDTAASREADPEAAGGAPIDWRNVFPNAALPGGAR